MKTQDWRRPLPGLIAWVAISSVAAEKSFGQGDEMREHARLVRIESIADGQNRATEMLPDSLLNFNDPVGTTLSGSLWTWGGTGRPLAILELSKLTAGTNSVRWVSGVTSFSPGSIVATWDDGQRWQSSAPGLKMNPVPDAPAPADSEAERGSYARCEGHLPESSPCARAPNRVKGKLELRLLPSPIRRYSDAGSGLRGLERCSRDSLTGPTPRHSWSSSRDPPAEPPRPGTTDSPESPAVPWPRNWMAERSGRWRRPIRPTPGPRLHEPAPCSVRLKCHRLAEPRSVLRPGSPGHRPDRRPGGGGPPPTSRPRNQEPRLAPGYHLIYSF